MLFKKLADGSLAVDVISAVPHGKGLTGVTVFRQYNPESKRLTRAEWMPLTYWHDLEWVEKTTRSEAWTLALLPMMFMIIAGLGLLMVPGLMIGDWLAARPVEYNWAVVARFVAAFGVVFAISFVVWYRVKSRWQVDL